MKENWERSIIKCIESFGREADRKQIYDNTRNFVELTEEHLKITYGRPNYYHQIRKHLSNMLKKEYIIISKDCYAVTEKGHNHSRIKLWSFF